MAQGVHSKNTFISIDGNDISSFTKSSDFSQSTDTHEATGYGSNSKSYIAGLNDSAFSCDGFYDSTSTAGTRGILLPILDGNVAVEVIHRPEGTGSGLPENKFDAILTSYGETTPVDDLVTWSASFQPSGDVDRTPQV